MTTALRSAINILLGRRHWPVPALVRPRSLEEQVFQALVHPGSVVFDIGANTGATAVLFGRLAGPTGQVIAFEPVPSTYLRLCAAIQQDTYEKAPVCTLPFGLADSAGMKDISMPGDQSGLASLALSADAVGPGTQVTTVRATFVTLDEVVTDCRLPPPTVLKVDVEGAELLVLKGATRLLREARPVLHLEIFAPWLRAMGTTPWEMLGHLADVGYEFIFTCPAGLIEHHPTAEKPFPSEFVGGYNVVCLDPHRHGDVRSRLQALRVGQSGLLPLARAPMPNR